MYLILYHFIQYIFFSFKMIFNSSFHCSLQCKCLESMLNVKLVFMFHLLMFFFFLFLSLVFLEHRMMQVEIKQSLLKRPICKAHGACMRECMLVLKITRAALQCNNTAQRTNALPHLVSAFRNRNCFDFHFLYRSFYFVTDSFSFSDRSDVQATKSTRHSFVFASCTFYFIFLHIYTRTIVHTHSQTCTCIYSKQS